MSLTGYYIDHYNKIEINETCMGCKGSSVRVRSPRLKTERGFAKMQTLFHLCPC